MKNKKEILSNEFYSKPDKYCDMTVYIEEKYYPLSKKGDKTGDSYYIIKYELQYFI